MNVLVSKAHQTREIKTCVRFSFFCCLFNEGSMVSIRYPKNAKKIVRKGLKIHFNILSKLNYPDLNLATEHKK